MLDVELVYNIEQLELILFAIITAVLVSIHAVIFKRNSRAAFAWFGAILLSPLFSAVMYLVLGWSGVLVVAPLVVSLLYVVIGINRIPRKFRKGKFRQLQKGFVEPHALKDAESVEGRRWHAIEKTGENLKYSPIQNCVVEMLNTGDAAYPEMLSVIGQAKKSITLLSYIFEFDGIGGQFIDALIAAKERGVEVRVLLDAVGSHRDSSRVQAKLKNHGISCGIFLPVWLKTRFSNMRNHRKLLVVDAQVAFAGGLNIADIYWPKKAREKSVFDVHFKLQGGVVNYLQEVFVNDWFFATGEILKSTPWYDERGDVLEGSNSLARVIIDGPSLEEERLRWHFLNAINTAGNSIKIVTPYFLPDEGVVAALCSAALRGVDVQILVPEKSDSRMMDWALKGSVFEMMARGCKFYCAGPSFDHSKLFLVDNDYISIGSANWDARSLRLNFELNVGIYSQALSGDLHKVFAEKKRSTKEITLEDIERRNIFVKVRDGFSRLLGPYL